MAWNYTAIRVATGAAKHSIATDGKTRETKELTKRERFMSKLDDIIITIMVCLPLIALGLGIVVGILGLLGII